MRYIMDDSSKKKKMNITSIHITTTLQISYGSCEF